MKLPNNRQLRSLFGVALLILTALMIMCVIEIIMNPYLNVSMSDRNREITKANSRTHNTKPAQWATSKQMITFQPMLNAQPVTHIGFLKVHKAASTTTQALFLRFGWRRKLTFVLPPEYNTIGYPNVISINESVTTYNILQPPRGKTFDILCHHVVFDKTAWESILPADTVYVGTVREPFAHFKSTLNYFNPEGINMINSDDPVGTFLKDPLRYEGTNIRNSYINNRISFEYGVDPIVILDRNLEEFDKYLKTVLNNVFSVVIVVELFDESLIVLRRKLNWTLKDVVYVIKNVRDTATIDTYNVGDELLPLHKNVSMFDYLLYDHFKKKLNTQIQNEGQSFWEELQHFKDVRRNIENFCNSSPRSIQTIRIKRNRWNDVFEISRRECHILHMGEISFTQMIRARQYGRATWSGPFMQRENL